jgi:hypothetical protein
MSIVCNVSIVSKYIKHVQLVTTCVDFDSRLKITIIIRIKDLTLSSPCEITRTAVD